MPGSPRHAFSLSQLPAPELHTQNLPAAAAFGAVEKARQRAVFRCLLRSSGLCSWAKNGFAGRSPFPSWPFWSRFGDDDIVKSVLVSFLLVTVFAICLCKPAYIRAFESFALGPFLLFFPEMPREIPKALIILLLSYFVSV